MDKIRTIITVFSFLFGLVFGCGLSYLGIIFINWGFSLSGKETVTFSIWNLLPGGILIGLSLVINTNNLVFKD